MANHPGVELIGSGDLVSGLQFGIQNWDREIQIGNITVPSRGLIELMDNNPLVCADVASVPDPLTTLALVGLGPALRAGMIDDCPVVKTNATGSHEALLGFLEVEGWTRGCEVNYEPMDLSGVLAMTATASVKTDNRRDVSLSYDECYSRSLYVKNCAEDEWHIDIVQGSPFAAYRIRFAEGEDEGLLTIDVMADSHGKCGAAQVVHMFNVMCGFEESLSIEC